MPNIVFNGGDKSGASKSLLNVKLKEAVGDSGTPATLTATVSKAHSSDVLGKLELYNNADTLVDFLWFELSNELTEYKAVITAAATSSDTANTSTQLNYNCAAAEFGSGGSTRLVVKIAGHCDGLEVDVRAAGDLGVYRGELVAGGKDALQLPFHVV